MNECSNLVYGHYFSRRDDRLLTHVVILILPLQNHGDLSQSADLAEFPLTELGIVTKSYR